MYHKTILGILCFFMAWTINAQQDFLGYSNSNYAGVSGIDLNPASIVDSRYKVDVSVLGTSINMFNNYVGLKSIALKTDSAFQDPDFQSKYLVETINGQEKSVYLDQRMILPSFMVTLSNREAMAFTWNIRTMINVDGVDEDLAQLVYRELIYEPLWKQKIIDENISIQTMSWADYGITYGREMLDANEHYLKLGARIKLLQGLQAAYMYVDRLEYDFTNDDTLSIFNTYASYGHSTNFEISKDNVTTYKFVGKPTVGLDIGVIYEWRPNWQDYKYDMDGEKDLWRRDENKYKLRAGLSITDLGRINFVKGEKSQNMQVDVKDWNINQLDLTNVSSFDDTLINRFVVVQSEAGQPFSMTLPMAVSAQIDYHIWKDFYVNATPYWAILFKKDRNRMHGLTHYSLTPRWDHKWFGVQIPLSYNSYGGMRIGIGLRLGPVILGTTNISPLFLSNNIYGFDAHMVLKVPIPYGAPKDRDEDHVSDPVDKCIDVPGLWVFKGCPDADGDGIQDSEDRCPTVPGMPEFQGCPDTDGDGIGDLDDDCIDIPGIPEFNGCPDTDGDGIVDSKDDCPDVPGPVEQNGCPDTDGDGIVDGQDECPTQPGLPEFFGCPETKLLLVDDDNHVLQKATRNEDGVFVFTKLPTDQHYLFRLEGDDSSFPDEMLIVIQNDDGQAILSAKRTEGGFFNYEYLPPEPVEIEPIVEPEPVIVLKPEEEKILKKAFDNLEFNTGSAIIRHSSYASLDELAGLLNKKEEWRLRLSGHTDNVGSELSNLALSKRRAEAVKNYIVEQSVAGDRIVVRYYGEMEPIAPNDTEEGRQKNRRVEMEIID